MNNKAYINLVLEIDKLKKETSRLAYDLNNVVMALYDLKIFKVNLDENGNPIIDTGKE